MAVDRLSPSDPNSYAKPEDAKVTHMTLELEVDFKTETLSGSVVLSVEKVNPEASVLTLDTRDLTISGAANFETKTPLTYELFESSQTFGQKLEIQLPTETKSQITVNYTTSSKATALQWLNPQQTSGKKHPFLFSQCQAIHCRSIVPCQDTPSNKITYNAKITAPCELVTLMSALRDGEPIKMGTKTVSSFRQPVPIPSYLVALVVGDLQSRQIGPRSHIWAEPDCLDAAAYEFADTESFLSAGEEICGPYVWGVYDLLLLPPSFPYGGMENPCLTFVTPTLLAGDRSLVNVVAHEIAHSWTGNLVTNANFEHFWLNEGFTVFVERKILGRIAGEAERNFAALHGLKCLKDAVEQMGATSQLTNLIPNLTGIDPDDAFSSVPYEKGQTLLWYLEELVGGKTLFEPFFKSYVAHFQYRSIVSQDFVDYLMEYFKNSPDVIDRLDKVDWGTWFHTPGMPCIIPKYDTSLATCCTDLCKKWCDWNSSGCKDPYSFSTDDLKLFSPSQTEEFLAELLIIDPLNMKAIDVMRRLYSFDSVRNSEIKFRWLRLCLRAHVKESIDPAIEFATSQGRMKFVRPLFRDLYNWEESRAQAIAAYEAAKSNWMWVTAYTVGKDLHVIQ